MHLFDKRIEFEDFRVPRLTRKWPSGWWG